MLDKVSLYHRFVKFCFVSDSDVVFCFCQSYKEAVEYGEYRGVAMNHDLEWKTHTNQAPMTLGFMKRLPEKESRAV